MRFLTTCLAVVLLLFAAVGVNAGAGASPASDPDSEAARLRVVEAVNTDQANFGVPYLEDDRVLVIPYVGQNAGRAGVENVLTPGLAVRWEKVEYSRSELGVIAAEIKDMHLEGLTTISSGTSRNRVVVQVGPMGSVEKVSEALRDYGDTVRVEATHDVPVTLTCTDRYDCQPWRGGIAIFRNDTNKRCTWGFQASNNGYLIMVTAGHCHKDGGKHNHDGVTIGSNGVSKNAINPSTWEGVDVLRTRVTGPDYPTTQNILYADTIKNWAITSVRSNAAFYVGMLVGKAGSSTNYTGGELDDVSVNYPLIAGSPGGLPHYPDCWVGAQGTCPWVIGAHSDTYAGGGDSGGPVFIGNTLLGFVSAGGGSDPPYGSGNNLYFARQEDAKNALGLDFWCTTSGCP